MISIGNLTAQANGRVTLDRVSGLNTVKALRITNYTTKVLLLTNINDGYQSQELLPPLTSTVFKNPGMDAQGSIGSFALGAIAVATPAQIVAGVTVEWANDPENDFLGTYPAIVGASA